MPLEVAGGRSRGNTSSSRVNSRAETTIAGGDSSGSGRSHSQARAALNPDREGTHYLHHLTQK